MKVLHVIRSVGPLYGGPSLAVRGMARGLTDAGLEVDIVTTDDNGPGRLSVALGTPLVEGRAFIRHFRRQTGFYTFSWPLTRWLAAHVCDYDLVHVHGLFTYATLPAAVYAGSRGVPYVICPHGTLDAWGMRTRRPRLKQVSYHTIERRILQGAAAIHYASTREELQAARLELTAPAWVVPMGIDITGFRCLPPRGRFTQRHPVLAGGATILYLSLLNRTKGLDLLIAAFARVRAVVPDATLVVAGSGDASYLAELRSLVAALGLTSDVHFVGFLAGDEKLEALAAADAFALPSHSENFGLAAVEAMAAGLAVVLSDQVGIAGDVSAAGAGCIVPCDIEALATTLTRLLRDPEHRDRLGRRAKQLVTERFSTESMVAGLLRMYQSVLARPSALGMGTS